MHFLLWVLVNHHKQGKFRAVAQTGKLLQCVLGFSGQAVQLPHYEVHHIVGVTLRVNPIQVPAPLRLGEIEGEQPLFGKRRNELNRKKWIASRLFVHELCQRGDALRLAVKRMPDQPPQVVVGERCKYDLLHSRSSLADRFELSYQRMGGIHFVVPVGADQHQVPYIRLSQKVLEEIERRSIEPLQIIEEQSKRMFGPCENADKPPEHKLEAALSFLWGKNRDRRLLSDNVFQFRDQVHDEQCVRT